MEYHVPGYQRHDAPLELRLHAVIWKIKLQIRVVYVTNPSIVLRGKWVYRGSSGLFSTLQRIWI